MAMRITTKMMQNNSLSNLNTNKTLQEKLTQQLSSQKKITRPSDDPVIAIRSLRLNCNLSKTIQFSEKNSKDAGSWLELTEKSVQTVSDVITDMRKYMVQASNGDLTADDRAAITENLKSLAEEIYSTGNTDFEGRSVFTGYRTSMPLTMKKDTTSKYTITEQKSNTDMDRVTFVKTGDLSEINDGNYMSKKTTEYDVETYDINRMRLSYRDLDMTSTSFANVKVSYVQSLGTPTTVNNAQTVSVSVGAYKFVSEDGSGDLKIYVQNAAGTFDEMNLSTATSPMNLPDGNILTFQETTDADGIVQGTVKIATPDGAQEMTINYTDDEAGRVVFEERAETQLTITDYYANDTDEAYMAAVDNPNSIVYIAETGEVLFGSDTYQQVAALSKETELRFTYDKTDWLDTDVNPIHYFVCTDEKDITYNGGLLINPDGNEENQVIAYDVGNNQSLRVNTTADEVFDPNIGRDVEEAISLLDQYGKIEDVLAEVDGMIQSGEYTGANLEQLELQKAALGKAKTNLNAKIQATFEGYQTRCDTYLKDCTLALTDVGSREARQKLIDNRLTSQKATYKELVSSNEDAEITELAVQLSSVELTYEASLSSISKILTTTLLDFI